MDNAFREMILWAVVLRQDSANEAAGGLSSSSSIDAGKMRL